MQKLLYADLGGDSLADTLASAGSNWSWPTLIQGTKLKLGFRLVEEVEGEFVEIDREVTSIRVKIGELYAKPESGTYRLHIGPIETTPVAGVNLTAEIAIGANAAAVQAAINATTIVGSGGTYGEATVTEADGSYFVTFAGETAAVPLRGANIRTTPISFIRVWASQMDGVWTTEIRPDKAGLAFADNIIEELPAAPVVTTFRPGVDNGDSTGINEIQKIVFNPRFRGIYEVRWSDRKSALLNRDDGPDQFGEAIAPLADEDGEFIVTNPSPNVGMVEFSGSMGAQPQDDLEIVVVDNPPADRYVILDLGTKVAADFLRAAELDDADEIDLPLEVEIRYRDPADENLILVWPWQDTITVRRRLVREGESTVNDTDYTRPVNARSYRPFNESQVAAGVHFYPFELGDGVNAVHTIDHGLGTLLVDVDLRENQPGGAFLIEGTDYTVAYDDEGPGEDAVVITLLGAYATAATGSLIGVVVGREQISHFEEDTTWEIPQINGLVDELDDVKARLAALEAQTGSGIPFTRTSSTAGPIERPLPDLWRVLRSKIATPAAPLLNWDPYTLQPPLKASRLLPAIHDATPETLPATLPEPSDALKGRVFVAATDRDDFPGRSLRAGDFAACGNGLDWYPVVQENEAESTYYPDDLCIELFRTWVSADELVVKSVAELLIGFEIAMFPGSKNPRERRTAGSYEFVLEVGTTTGVVDPETVGANLDAFFTDPIRVIEQRIIVTEVPSAHRFGLRVIRDAVGALEALAIRYRKEAACTAPAAATFAIRGSLRRPDFEDDPRDPRGLIAVRGPRVGLDGQEDPTLGQLTIS